MHDEGEADSANLVFGGSILYLPEPPAEDEERIVTELKRCHFNYHDRNQLFHYRHLALNFLLNNWPEEAFRRDTIREANISKMEAGEFARVVSKEALDRLSQDVLIDGKGYDPAYSEVKRVHDLLSDFHQTIADLYAKDAHQATKDAHPCFSQRIPQIKPSDSKTHPVRIIDDIRFFAKQVLLPHVYEHGLVGFNIGKVKVWEEIVGLTFEDVREEIERAYHPSPENLRERFEQIYKILLDKRVIVTEERNSDASSSIPKTETELREQFRIFAVDLYVLFAQLKRWDEEAEMFATKNLLLIKKLEDALGEKQMKLTSMSGTLLHVSEWNLGYMDPQTAGAGALPGDGTFDLPRTEMVKTFLDGMSAVQRMKLLDELDGEPLDPSPNTVLLGKIGLGFGAVRLAFDSGKCAVTHVGCDAHREILEYRLDQLLSHVERFVSRSSPVRELHSHWPNSLSPCVKVHVVASGSFPNSAVRFSKVVDADSGQAIVEVGLRTDGYYQIQRGQPRYLSWCASNDDERGTDIYQALKELRKSAKEIQLVFSFYLDDELVEVRRNLNSDLSSSTYPLPCCKATEIEIESGEEGTTHHDGVPFLRLVLMTKIHGLRQDEIAEHGKVIVACIQTEMELKRLRSHRLAQHTNQQSRFALYPSKGPIGALVSGDADTNNAAFTIPLLVQHHASSTLLKNLGASNLQNALKEMWEEFLYNDAKQPRNAACKYILENLPTKERGGIAESPRSPPIHVTDARTADSIAQHLRQSFHFPVEFMSVNHSCFTAKFNMMQSLSQSPIITFLFVSFEVELQMHQLSAILNIFREHRVSPQLRIVVAITPWLVNMWGKESELVCFDENAVEATELTRLVRYNRESRIGCMIKHSETQAAQPSWLQTADTHGDVLRKAYAKCTLRDERNTLLQIFDLVESHGGVSSFSRNAQDATTISRYISCCSEGYSSSELEGFLTRNEEVEGRYTIHVIDERFRSTSWEAGIKARAKSANRLVLVCKSPDCCGFDNLAHLATFLRQSKIVCDVVIPVNEHDLRYFQNPCRIADSGNIEVHTVRLYRPVVVPPFSFFVRNTPVCEFLSQRSAVALYKRIFGADSITPKCATSEADNIDDLCIGGGAAPEEPAGGGGSSNLPSATPPDVAPRYHMSVGDPSSIEVLSRGICSSTIPWEGCEVAWTTGFPLSNSVLFGIIMTTHFPLRILACIPPTMLFSRLLIMQKEVDVPWVEQLRARVTDRALTSFLETTCGGTKPMHHVRTAVAVVRWALVCFGCDVPFDGSDFALVVDAKILIDPAAVTHQAGDDGERLQFKLLQLLFRLDNPDNESRSLFTMQAKVREFFLKTIRNDVGRRLSEGKMGSALLGLLLSSFNSPTPSAQASEWVQKSHCVSELRAWNSSTKTQPSAFVVLGSYCLTQSAMIHLARSSQSPAQLQVVLDAILQPTGDEAPHDNNKRIIRALLQLPCVETTCWQAFETIRHLLEVQRPNAAHVAKDDCILVLREEEKLPHTATLRAFAGVLNPLDFDSATYFQNFSVENRDSDMQIPLEYVQAIAASVFPDASFDATSNDKLEKLVRFVMCCLSESTRIAIIQRSQTMSVCDSVNSVGELATSAPAETFYLFLACWMQHPTLSFDVPESKLNMVKHLYAMLRTPSSDCAKACRDAFVKTVREQFYNVPVLALALTDQRELLSESSYAFYCSTLGWPSLKRVVFALAKQNETFPDYFFSGSCRPLSHSVRKSFFAAGQIHVDTPACFDNKATKKVAAAVHVRLGEGVTKETIRRNVEFLLHAPCDDHDFVAIACCVKVWFASLGVSDEDLVEAVSKEYRHGLKMKLARWKSIKPIIEHNVFAPMPATMDLRVRVCCGTVILFGEYNADRLYTIRSLCQCLSPAAARNVVQRLPNEWTHENLMDAVASASVDLIRETSSHQDAAACARAFISMVIFVWQQRFPNEAETLLRKFGQELCCQRATTSTDAAFEAAFISISLAAEWSEQLMTVFLASAHTTSGAFKIPSVIIAEVKFSNSHWSRSGVVATFTVPSETKGNPKRQMLDAEDICWDAVRMEGGLYDALTCSAVASATAHESDRTQSDAQGAPKSFFEQEMKTAGGAAHSFANGRAAVGFTSSTTHSTTMSCGDIRVVDMRSLVSFKVSADQPFGYLCIKDGFQCYLAKTGTNGQYKIFTQHDDTRSLTNIKTFPSFDRAWRFLLSLNFSGDHPPTLTLDGCFFTKGLNSKWLLFIAHPTENVRKSPAMLWHIVAFHALLHVDLCSEIVDAIRLMFRWTLEHHTKNLPVNSSSTLDILTRQMCADEKQSELKTTFSAIWLFLKTCISQVGNNLDHSEIAEDIILKVLELLGGGGGDEHGEPAIGSIIRNVLRNGLENNRDGGANRRCEDLAEVLRNFLSEVKRSTLTELLSAAHDDTVERRVNASDEERTNYLQGVFWNPCDLISVCKPLVSALLQQRNTVRKLHTVLGGTNTTMATDNALFASMESKSPRSSMDLVEPKFGHGRLMVPVAVGESALPSSAAGPSAGPASEAIRFVNVVRTDRATFMTDEAKDEHDNGMPGRSVGYIVSPDILLRRNIVGCFYDENIIKCVASRFLKSTTDDVERNSQITDLRRFFEFILVCPFNEEIKGFFMRHMMTTSVDRIDSISLSGIAGMEALFDKGLLGTVAMLLGVAQALPIPRLSQIVLGALDSRLTVNKNIFEICTRKNGKYGVHVVPDAALFYSGAKLIHRRVEITDLSLPDAEIFEQIVEKFSELVTHVIVSGLPCISDRLLKWLAEYTMGFPWRWVVLVRTSIHYNWPENRDRVYFPKNPSTQMDKIEPHKGEIKLLDVPLSEQTDVEMLKGDEQTKLRDNWETLAKPLKYAVTFVVSPPGAGKSKFTQALEAEGHYMIFNVDCSNPILARESITTLLDQSFPKENIKNALLVADEFHFLDVALKEMLFAWIRPRLTWLKVLLIANRSDATDIKVMERSGLAVEDATDNRPSTAVFEKVYFINGRCGMAKMVAHTVLDQKNERDCEYVRAFHCTRRALFSDEVSTLRNRELVLKSCHSGSAAGITTLLCDQLAICEDFFPALVANVFHSTMKDVERSDKRAAGKIVLDKYRNYVASRDGPRSLVLCAMLPYFCRGDNGHVQPPDAVLSFSEVCERLKLDKVHPAYRFHYWCEYVHKYCKLPPVESTCLDGFKRMRMVVRGFFPVIYTDDIVTYTAVAKIEAHVVPYHSLDEITDAVVRHKALDWDSIRIYWAEHFVTDITSLEKLLSAMGDSASMCMACLSRQNITMLLRQASYTQESFAFSVLKHLGCIVDENSMYSCDSPWLIAVWGFIKSQEIETWRADPMGKLREFVKKFGEPIPSLADLAQHHYPVADDPPAISIEILVLTWVSEYGNCFNEVARGDCQARDECLRLMLGKLLHDVIGTCTDRGVDIPLRRLVCGELACQLWINPNGEYPFTLHDASKLVDSIDVSGCSAWPMLMQLVARARQADRSRKSCSTTFRPLDSSCVLDLWSALRQFPHESIPQSLIAPIAFAPDGLPMEVQRWIAEDERKFDDSLIKRFEHKEGEGIPQLRRNFVELARFVVNEAFVAKFRGCLRKSLDEVCERLKIF